MALVSYADSEESEDEVTQARASEPAASTTTSEAKFTVDKANPRKIKVNLREIEGDNALYGDEEEPAPKRARVGGGGFSGFNSMLPAPKKNGPTANGAGPASSTATKKAFSLRTGAEPGFSRESDAELRQLLTEQGGHSGSNTSHRGQKVGGEVVAEDNKSAHLQPAEPFRIPKQSSTMFKPLSVARSTQKKKKPPENIDAPGTMSKTRPSDSIQQPPATIPPPEPKPNLFSIGSKMPSELPTLQDAEYQPESHNPSIEEDWNEISQQDSMTAIPNLPPTAADQVSHTRNQSLDSIATDLNLSASARRQLLGRNAKRASQIPSSSVINFNTDQEYAANEVFRTSGEQVQHNPVRAIAPGKHSLKQLVNAASGQKEALEESFAAGRRNKMEAGARYGW